MDTQGEKFSTPGDRTTKAFLCAKSVGAYLSKVCSSQYRLHGCNRLLLLIVTAPSKSSRHQFSMHAERTTKAFLCVTFVGAYLSKVRSSQYHLHGHTRLLLLIVTAPSKSLAKQFSLPAERTMKAFLCAKFVGAYLPKACSSQYRLHGCNRLILLIVTAPSKSSGDQCSTHGERTTKAFLCAKFVGAYLSKVCVSQYRLHGCNRLLPLIVIAPSKSSGDQFPTA